MLLLCGLFVLSFGLVARGATSVPDQDAVLIYEHPYVVSLEYRGQHVCGGSILNDQWILTAAHCLENRTADFFKIAAGSSGLATSTLYSVEALVSHKNFTYAPDPSYFAVGDIGLVRVNGTIHFSHSVLPIAFHRQNTIDDQVLGKFAGWGPSQAANASDVNQLRITELFFPSLENCSKLNPRYFNPEVSCTVPISDDPEACDYYVGGGGGPLVVNDSLVGVALRMDNCNGTGPSYTRVWHYEQWIESTMKDWNNQENQTIDYSTYPPYSTPRPTTRYPPYSTPRPTTRYPPYSTPRPTTRYPPYSTPRPTTRYPPYSTPRPTTRYPPYSTPWPTTKYPTYPPHNTTTPYPPHNTTYPPYPWHNTTTERPGKKINIQFYFSMSGNGTISFPN